MKIFKIVSLLLIGATFAISSAFAREWASNKCLMFLHLKM